MFSSKQRSSVRIGALIEVGSGSVLVALVASHGAALHPKVIWWKREFSTLRTGGSFADNQKAMLTTLMNCCLSLDSEGRKEQSKNNYGTKIDTIQVSISAPWAHTISKVISYDHDNIFTITEELISELTKKANESTLAVLRESNDVSHQLSIMTRAITNITGNGYRTMAPLGQKVNQLTLTQVSAVADTILVEEINELKAKCFETSSLERFSTMLIFHAIVRELYPTMSEYCLVDITYEATEIALVREGVLHYTTHTPIGINTLTRSIAHKLNRPVPDIDSLLKSLSTEKQPLTSKEQEAIDLILNSYQENLETLFHETGDSLSIPKLLFLHGTYEHEQLLDDYITNAAHKATLSTHTIHRLTGEVLTELYTKEDAAEILKQATDTRLLMISQFFHKPYVKDTFTNE